MNATAICVGGSIAKQIDCGAGSYANSATIPFNFTFTNTPNVFVNSASQLSPSYLCNTYAYSVTKTGFSLSLCLLTAGSASLNGTWATTITWCAIG